MPLTKKAARKCAAFLLVGMMVTQPAVVAFADDETVSGQESAASNGSANEHNAAVSEEQSDPTSIAPDESAIKALEGAKPIEEELEDGSQMQMSLLEGEEDSSFEVPGQSLSAQAPLKIDQSTGALTQRISFSVPPGRDDLTPDIALLYNSQQLEDSIAGYGWMLSIPSIERLNKAGSERLYTDNVFTSSLGGELVETSSSGEYTHRFEDGRFIRYVFANNTWTAYDKAGTRYTFGTTTAARQAATSSPSNVYAWALEEVRDTNDNFIRFEYTKDGNQIYPSKAIYTGYGSTDGIFEVEFSYETRPDPFTSYKPGFRVDTTKRLTEVRASVDGEWVRKYTLAYASGVNGLRSLLASVQETGRDEDANELSLPPTTFGYSSSTPQYETHTNPRIWNSARVAADLDGNGLPDRAIFWSNSTTTAATRVVDLNNYPTFASSTQATTSEFWATHDTGTTTAGEYPFVERGVRVFDINGDGRADILRGYKDSLGALMRKYYQKSPASLAWSATSTPYATPIFACSAGGFSLPTGVFGDINGDGLTDYAASSTVCSVGGSYLGGGKTMWSAAPSFAAVAPMATTTTDARASQLIDINGDGLDDWMYSANGQTQFHLNTGTGWGPADSRWTISTTTRHANGWDRGIRFVDINGDGLPDYVRAYTMPSYSTKAPGISDIEVGTHNYVYLNTGNGFAASALTVPEYIFNGGPISGEWTGWVDYNELVDWNGDGILDSAGKTSASSATIVPDVIVQTTYSTGGRTLVEHKLTSQMASDSAELPFPVLVVTKLTNGDNLGGSEVTTYAYEGGKIYFDDDNVRDRRFAGFRKITREDALGSTDTYFHQGDIADTANGEQNDSFALIGKAYREDVRDASGNALKKTFYEWSVETLSGTTTAIATTTDRVRALLVGGGGGTGGSVNGGKTGGGGGGEVFDDIAFLRSGASYTITIGSGGMAGQPVEFGNWATKGGEGGTSSIGPALSAFGGGGGGAGAGAHPGGGINGGGGGAYNDNHGLFVNGANGDSFDGGRGAIGPGNTSASGGGAGAGGDGGHGTAYFSGTPSSLSIGGNAGVGVASTITGTSQIYGPGGIGVGREGDGTPASGTNYGRGANGFKLPHSNPTSGIAGYPGIVVIRFKTGSIPVTDQTGATATTSGGDTILTWTSGGSFTYSPTATTTTAAYYYTSLASESVQDWEGGGTHKDKAVEYAYSTTTGNLLQKIELGEVAGNADGTYADTGSDTRTTTFTYSATTSANLTLPTSQTVLNDASTKVAETRYYYDNQGLGTATKGNLTKEEKWIAGSTYASSTKQYDVRGLVIAATDARGKTTTYDYDEYDLYPATTTNPLGHITTSEYDYAKGAPKLTKDANGLIRETVFDPVGRVKEEWQSDIASPSTLVLARENTYTDTFPARAHTRSYLTATNSVDAYVYRDGLGRMLQERREAENNNTYIVKDYLYDAAGLLAKESLPYFGTGSARTAATSTVALYSVHTHDALRRPTAIGTAVGTTTYVYTPWQTSTIDANGIPKDAEKDAHGNLVRVVEHNGGSDYTTAYEYDTNGNLTKITDALGNVRNFTYDGLGRRLTAQDLHASADGTFGVRTYAYDAAGNLASSTDPRSQTIVYAYDALNRVLTENYTGAGGTEVSYAYDSCANGKGRLCTATSTGATTNYTYNVLGNTASETKRIDGTNYATSYVYDRQGNITGIVYPDDSEVAYAYNEAGLPESVQYKPASGSFSDIVSNLDYAPTGAVSYKELGNDTATTYTFDPNELYRLKRIETLYLGGIGGSLEDLTLEAIAARTGEVLGTSTASFDEAEVGFEASATGDEASEAATSTDGVAPTQETISLDALLDAATTTSGDAGIETSTPAVATTTDALSSEEGAQTGKPTLTRGKLIKNADNARAWRRYHEERVAYLEKRTDLPPQALEAALHGQQAFEERLVEQGYVAEPQGEIREPISVRTWNFLGKILAFMLPERAYAYVFGMEDFESCGSLPCSFNDSDFWGGVAPSLDHTGKVSGVDSLKEVVTAEGGGGLIQDGLSHSELWVQFKMFVPDPLVFGISGYAGIFDANAANDDAFVWLNLEDYGTPRLTLGGNSLSYTDTGLDLVEGAVNTIEMRIKTGTSNGDVDIWLNNSTEGSPDYNGSGTMNLGAGTIEHIMAGLTYIPENGFSTTYYDDIVADTAFVGSGGATNTPPTAPSALLAEGQTNPSNVTDSTPEFSAIYNDANTGDTAAKYRIQVATTSAFASILWDSGTSTMATTSQGARSPDISYAGAALASSTTYYWRIKFWDNSDAEGAWSTATSSFSLAAAGGGGATTTSFYAVSGGDGELWRGGSNWNTQHDSSSGTAEGSATTAEVFSEHISGSSYYLGRIALPFDTSALPDDATITSATLKVYVDSTEDGDNDGDDFIRVVQNSTASAAALANGDFDQIGAIDNPTAGATDTDITGISSGAYLSIPLNAIGKGWISTTGYTKLGLREGHDAKDVAPSSGTGLTGVIIRSANYTGTAYDPILEVSYTVGGGENSAPTAPTGLLLEGQSSPATTTDATPEFSAIYNDPDDGDEANRYRIQVATTSIFSSVFWDSGSSTMATTTEGDRSPEIAYDGPSLTASTTYYWRIKFWDVAGAEGAWSTATSTFSLADEGTTTPMFVEVLQDISYTYDPVGNITEIADHSETGTGKTVVYAYDDLHRMTSASTTAASSTPYRYQYAYNALGNITGVKVNDAATTTYSYAGTGYANPHAATSIGGAMQTYDNAGNLTSDGTWTHSWDYRNRLISSSGGASTTYAYDHTTARVALTENGTTTAYANKYFDTDGTTPTRSIFTPGGELLATVAGASTTATSYVHADHLGSANATTDGDGALAQVLDYYPYGAERVAMGVTANARHYIGERMDEETDLNYLNARYYNGTKGQFISQDPVHWVMGSPHQVDMLAGQKMQTILVEPQLLNSYSYARSNPARFKDPSGNATYIWNNGAGMSGIDTWDTNTYYEYNDVNMLNANAAYMESVSGSLLTYPLFAYKVWPGSEWDFKEKERVAYFFDGRLVTAEEFGNLHYGYVGSAGNIAPVTLKVGGGGAQLYARTSSPSFVTSYFDDPTDTGNIQVGINAYSSSGRSSVSSSALSSASNAVSAASRALSAGNISGAISAIKSAISALSR